ncbi:MAG: SDR family NAD(P)-dependent oxidoreductase [Acidimicrobiales bacterium]|nr:SDR family NAD(P)-dependent oxidoreductase [Acidimicrobiales bacterium]
MELRDKVVVVTGGASGIGRALCRSVAAAGMRRVVVADVAAAVAGEIGGTAVACDERGGGGPAGRGVAGAKGPATKAMLGKMSLLREAREQGSVR